MSSSRDQLERYLSQIHVEADRVLDIGGGEKPVNTRTATWKVGTYHILDNVAAYKPDIFADVNTPFQDQDIPISYDVVFALEISEYVFDPATFHANIYHVLNRGGVAYISYHALYPLHAPEGKDMLRYTKNAIEKLLTVCDFLSWEITPRVATNGLEDLRRFYANEHMHPLKGSEEVFDTGYMVRAIA